MNIEQLQSVEKLIKYKNYSVAADELYIAQSTLTKRIQALEQELGVQLFHRMSKIVKLSPVGELMLPSIQRILDSYDDIIKLAASEKAKHANLSVYCAPSLHISNLGNLLANFQLENPYLCMHIQEGDIASLVNTIQTNSAAIPQCAIVRNPWPTKIPHSKSLKLLDDELVLACNVNHPLARAHQKVSLFDLNPYSLALLTSGITEYELMLQPYKISLNVSYTCSSLQTLKGFLEKNLSIVIVSRSAFSELASSESIIALPFVEPLDCSLYFLITSGQNTHDSKLLFSYLSQHFAVS